MKSLPSRGLPPRTVVIIVACIAVLAAIPIVSFLRTGFGTNGSSIAPASGSATPPPAIAAALAALRERIARNPRDVEAYEALAGLYAEAGKTGEALALEQSASAIAPGDMQLRSTYAGLLRSAGKSGDAVAQYTIILRARPGDANALFSRGMVLAEQHRQAAARTDLRAFMHAVPASDPRSAEARLALENM